MYLPYCNSDLIYKKIISETIRNVNTEWTFDDIKELLNFLGVITVLWVCLKCPYHLGFTEILEFISKYFVIRGK